MNTTAYHWADMSLHLLLLKSSMANVPFIVLGNITNAVNKAGRQAGSMCCLFLIDVYYVYLSTRANTLPV